VLQDTGSVPPAHEGDRASHRTDSVPPVYRGNLKEGVLDCPCLCEVRFGNRHDSAISTTWAQDSPDALAPGAFGTRAGAPVQRVVSPDASSSGWAQLGLALLIVAVGLRWGLPRLMRWAGKTGDGSPLDGQIRIIETRSAVGGSLMLVKARDKLLLIGATPQGMHLLADLTDTLPKSEPVSLAESAFERVLRTARPVASLPDLQQEAAAHVQSRLRQTRARLQSLLGGQP
jgi:flagellar biogenesis protein FliO